MLDLFSPFTLKGVTPRSRIAMSPMKMRRTADSGRMTGYVMLMGSRATGGFSLQRLFPQA